MARYCTLRVLAISLLFGITFFVHIFSQTKFPAHFVNAQIFQTLCCVIDAGNSNSNADFVNDVVGALVQKVMAEYPTMNRNNFFFEVGGKPLSNSSTVSIRNGSTVFVQYRLRGGCFLVSFTIMMTIFLLILSSTCTCGTSLLLVPLLLPFLFVLPLFCL
jgi:hypothetical protein